MKQFELCGAVLHGTGFSMDIYVLWL